jgi:hypothetical protein
MGYRYAVATLGAYAVFLLLIRIWIALLRGNDPSSWLDAIPDISSGDAAPAGDALAGFSGGSSGGAGVSGSWGSPGDGASSLLVPDIDVDDAWPVVVALIVGGIVLLGAAAALIYVVYYAPVLLAEIALDAALVTGIYRRLRKQDARYWLSSAIRHTWKPAVVITVCLFALGSVIQWAVPTARTIGDLLR